MNFYIIGGLGHIGSYLIRNLPKFFPKSNFIIIDNLSTQKYSSLFNLNKKYKYKFIYSDIKDLNLQKIPFPLKNTPRKCSESSQRAQKTSQKCLRELPGDVPGAQPEPRSSPGTSPERDSCSRRPQSLGPGEPRAAPVDCLDRPFFSGLLK